MNHQKKLPKRKANEFSLPELNEDVIKAFLENQKTQLVNESEQLRLKYNEMQINARLAEKSMEFQAAHLSRQSMEVRKSVTRIAYIIGGFLLVFLGFIGYCLYLDRTDFIIAFLKSCGYLVTTFMGYWFGQRSAKHINNKKGSRQVEEAEIINAM